jgi:membrane protein DedA with SNARE-associated domain
MAELFHSFTTDILPVYGPWVVFLVIALESAGVPLPGEATLMAAAILASASSETSIAAVVLAAALGASIGDSVGYWVGPQWALPLIQRDGRWLHLSEERLRTGRYIFARYGGTIVFCGRFVAFVRTFAALLAGINKMPWRRFLIFNVSGAFTWASIVGFGSYRCGLELSSLPTSISSAFAGGAILIALGIASLLRRYEGKWADEARKAQPHLS